MNSITTYTYDAAHRMLTTTDARGITYLTNEYDLTGRVIRQTQVDTGVWTLAYTATGTRVTQTVVTDPRGNPTIHRFNAQGGEVETVNALGQPTRPTFDFATNQLLDVRDPLNRVTRFTYDLMGNVTSWLDPQGHATLFEYEPTFNRVTQVTDALNQQTRFAYDPLNGNLLTVTDPLTHATNITYNQFGQPISVIDALNHTTTFEYNEVGDVIATVDPLGNRTLRFYDAVSRLIALVDPRGKSTTFIYDSLNRVSEIRDTSDGRTLFTYDPNGNLLTVTDVKNQTTTYTYDNMDRLATRKDPLNRTESYQYDLAGNLTQFTDRKNQVTTFTYDALNRRTQAAYPDATTTFTYDTVGRLVKASDTASGAGTIDLAYDILDRLIQETTPLGTVAYQYDVLGRRTQMTANGQPPTTYQYDAASRLTRVEQGALFAALGYDNVNRRTNLSYSNNTTTSYAYDLASRLTNITHAGPSGIIEALTYQYDAAGNRVSLTRSNGAATLLPPEVQAAYDAANEQIQFNATAPNQTYDANGNLMSQTDASGTTTYSWDSRNRLLAISGPGLSASFTYDAIGRRVSKTINGVTAAYHYDRRDIIAEQQGSAVLANYLRKLCLDEAYVRHTTTGNEYYHTDALGSALALSDQDGAMQTSYFYEPFGKTSVTGASSNPFQYTQRENDATGLYYYRARYYNQQSMGFISEDPLLSLFYPGNEKRSPVQISKFPRQAVVSSAISGGIDLLSAMSVAQGLTQKLPLSQLSLSDLSYSNAVGAPEVIHPYAYVGDNPINRSDPTGLGQPSECKQYENDCGKGMNAYSCIAIQPCKNANGPLGEQRGNCIRNCLLDEYRGGCTTITCQVGAHKRCFSQCW